MLEENKSKNVWEEPLAQTPDLNLILENETNIVDY